VLGPSNDGVKRVARRSRALRRPVSRRGLVGQRRARLQFRLGLSDTLGRRTLEVRCGLAAILRHASPLHEQPAERQLCSGEALLRRAPVPHGRQPVVASDAIAGGVGLGKSELGLRVALFGRLAVPEHGLGGILHDAVAVRVHHGQRVLGFRVAERGGPPAPGDRLPPVAGHAVAPRAHQAEAELRFSVALDCRLAAPDDRLGLVLCDAAAARMHDAQHVGRLGQPLLGGLPEQRGCQPVVTFHGTPFGVKQAEAVLSQGVAPFGGPAIPGQAEVLVAPAGPPAGQAPPEVEPGRDVAFFGPGAQFEGTVDRPGRLGRVGLTLVEWCRFVVGHRRRLAVSSYCSAEAVPADRAKVSLLLTVFPISC
jgi:hypothetical protein